MKTVTTFQALGLSANTLLALEKKGFINPTPIQAAIIPKLLHSNNDIIGQAQTGTGKTAAFGLPLIEKLPENSKYVQALILTPTRELAVQVADEIKSLKGKKALKITTVYGGLGMREQLRELKQGVDIVVGTPGRVLDHISRKSLDLSKLSHIILDEGDEMLNMGFIDDIKLILDAANSESRILLFSATMPKHLMKIAENYMQNQEVVRVEQQNMTSHLTEQQYFEVRLQDKLPALCRIIDASDDFYAIIFCRTKIDVEALTHQLLEKGYKAEGIHGDVTQFNREKVLKKFKLRQANILVATDVAARGIDVNNLTHVINYALPSNPETYVHRIGRTGRAGQTGIAITFIVPSEFSKLSFIKRITKTDIKKGTLPSVKDILKFKTQKMCQTIEDIIEKNTCKEYDSLAQKLLHKHEPSVLVAALLKQSFQEQSLEDKYPEVEDLSFKKSFSSSKKKPNASQNRNFRQSRPSKHHEGHKFTSSKPKASGTGEADRGKRHHSKKK